MTGPAPVTRLAPTPSGYLHLGNAWSFVITWLAARSRGGRIHLRIDDLDTARLREEYLEDIFASLEWLGLDYDSGPRDVADFRARHSQRLRLDAYRAALAPLLAARTPEGPVVYACACTRNQIRRAAESQGVGSRGAGGESQGVGSQGAGAGAAQGGTPGGEAPILYPGTCRALGLDREDLNHTLRLRCLPDDTVDLSDLAGGSMRLEPARTMGDFVLRQKGGDPAYQLASLIDDESMGINLVVRGLNLLPSTGAQALLARHLGLKHFPRAAFLHHGLLLGAGGAKLSKSAGDTSLASLRARLGGPQSLLRGFAAALGLSASGVRTVADLLPGFAPERVPTTPWLWENFLTYG